MESGSFMNFFPKSFIMFPRFPLTLGVAVFVEALVFTVFASD